MLLFLSGVKLRRVRKIPCWTMLVEPGRAGRVSRFGGRGGRVPWLRYFRRNKKKRYLTVGDGTHGGNGTHGGSWYSQDESRRQPGGPISLSRYTSSGNPSSCWLRNTAIPFSCLLNALWRFSDQPMRLHSPALRPWALLRSASNVPAEHWHLRSPSGLPISAPAPLRPAYPGETKTSNLRLRLRLE